MPIMESEEKKQEAQDEKKAPEELASDIEKELKENQQSVSEKKDAEAKDTKKKSDPIPAMDIYFGRRRSTRYDEKRASLRKAREDWENDIKEMRNIANSDDKVTDFSKKDEEKNEEATGEAAAEEVAEGKDASAGEKESAQEKVNEVLADVENESEKEIDDLEKADSSQQAANSLSFKPVSKKRTSFVTKLKNRLIFGLKGILGAVAAVPVLAVTGISRIIHKITEKKRLRGAMRNRSESRPEIVGRDTSFLSSNPAPTDSEGKEEVYDRTENVPLVWERLSAADADEAPRMSILVDQAKAGSSVATHNHEMGHSMIDLSYSRHNNITGRKERYGLRYGFYPGGGNLGQNAQVALGAGAIMTGQLIDDWGHSYSIGREYNVTAEQVNKVLRASERYAEGGYGFFKRNCTTFVVDMAKEAGLSVAEKDLKEEEMDFDADYNASINLSNAFALGGRYIAAMGLEEKLKKNDLTYANFGQKMATLEDRDRYFKTAPIFSGIKKGYSPGMAGEQLRNSAEGGTLTSKSLKNEGDLNRLKLVSEADKFQSILHNKLFVGDGPFADPQKQTDADKVFMDELELSACWGDFKTLARNPKGLTSSFIKSMHKEFRDWTKMINDYYTTRLGQSQEYNEDIMNILSCVELALTEVDVEYQKVATSEAKGDLARAYMDFDNNNYSVSAVMPDGKGEYIGYNALDISPSLYEAYLQIYGDAVTAMKQINEYNLYKDMVESSEGEEKEKNEKKFAPYERVHSLAKDFEKSHRYRLGKKNFNENDMKYAMVDLPRLETSVAEGVEVEGDLGREVSYASGIYQAKIFEPVFEGFMEENFKTVKDSDELSGKVSDRLVELSGREGRSEKLLSIIKYYINNVDTSDNAETVTSSFMKMFSGSYLKNTLGYVKDTEVLREVSQKLEESSSLKEMIKALVEEALAAKKMKKSVA